MALAGQSGRVISLEDLPNGDLAVGGWTFEAGRVIANWVARYDGVTWSAFAASLDYNVYDLAVALTGEVIVAGAAPADLGLRCGPELQHAEHQ